jgi:hypothetical protein
MSSSRRRRAPLGAFLVSGGALVACLLSARDSSAQACCAGSGVVTPGRLAMADTFLVGVQVHAGRVIGNFNNDGHFAVPPARTDELEFDEDLFATVRVLHRGQVSLLVPLLETYRKSGAQSELGGGLGDVNLAVRWDFHDAGDDAIPGIAVLGGVTFPTGTAPESASKPLATDATGVGAFQGTLGLAFEQIWGPWLATASGRVSKRLPRTALGIDSELGAQWTILASGAYVFKSGVAVAPFVSYTWEGSATVDGAEAPASARRGGLFGVSGLLPIAESWRLQSSITTAPPISGLGRNEPALLSLTVGVVKSW